VSARTKQHAASHPRSQNGHAGLQAQLALRALPALSVVIPTLNEAQSIGELLRRLHATMARHAIDYEAIIVDDHSSDGTVAVAEQVIAELRAPARVLLKRGKPGKTYSLMQGLDEARCEAFATLDGDLQYPPEALPALLGALNHADVVVGDRRDTYSEADQRRARASRVFNTVVGRGVLSLATDVQSGMKVFRREVYDTALLRPGPWSFDLELLAAARENGFRIANSPIEMQPRLGGESKAHIARVGAELGLRALATRLHFATHTAADDAAARAKLTGAGGQGIAPAEPIGTRAQARRYERWLMYEAMEAKQARASGEAERYAEAASQEVSQDERRFRPFAPYRPQYSALGTFSNAQISVLTLLGFTWVTALLLFGLKTLAVTLGAVTALYLFDLAVTAFISTQSLRARRVTTIDDQVARAIREEYWPSYTILCPLYCEAEVAAQFVNAIRLLDYPTDRLQVLFLTEEDDEATRAALLGMRLPAHFEVVTVPDGQPRTKPRACNYGLLQATGDFVVIYDAEDIPDPLQLKKAALTFGQHAADLACVQASLNFYNPTQNALTRWFTSEYSLWFDLTLPALQRMKSFLPLGGTSNHFRTRILREVGGWDPFNVTEDCDLGVRLAQFHYRTAMVDSTTYEEANPDLRNWLRQRSRWVKGYMQTYLVHMRDPLRYVREGRLAELFWLQVIVGGKSLAQLVNPLLWLLLVIYLVFHAWVTPLYHILFPAPVFYASAFCLVVGNFFYVYSYLIGSLNRRQYLLTLWALAIPLYWALMSVASYIALYQLLTRPYYWEKTRHGLVGSARAELSASLDGLRGALLARRLPWQSAARLDRAPATRRIRPLGHGARRTGLHVVALLERWPLTRDALAYVAHEAAMVRREISRRGQQDAWLAPALALPVAPVVDMLSTTVTPVVRPVARVSDVRRAAQTRETHYLVALRPLAQVSVAREHPRRAPLRWLRDRWQMMTLASAIASSVSAFLYYFSQGETLLYRDANSHLRLGGLPLDAATPGLAQLGSAWLPLPHALMWPFIWNGTLLQTGMAGSFVGMITFVVASLYVFKSARLLSRSDVAGYIGALAFMLNPNVLYLQTTPLSEGALLAVFAATIFYFLAWAQSGRAETLYVAAGCALLGTITRYEGWSLFFAMSLLVVAVNVVKRRSLRRIIGEALIFVTPGSAAIGLWLLWCYLLTGNPLYFENGPYSARSQQSILQAEGYLPTIHNLPLDVYTYAMDVAQYAGPLIVALAVFGVVTYLLRVWKRPEGVAALALIAPLALYIVTLFSGQIVIYVPGVSTHVVPNELFNVRYATTAMIPLAVFIATLLGRRRLLQALAVALILAQTALTAAGGIIALQDGQRGMSCMPFTQTDVFLAEHYNGGRMLTDMYQNAMPYPLLGIPLDNTIYIGSYNLWGPALADPAKYVDWVVTRPGDAVSQQLDVTGERFTSQFLLVEKDSSGDQVFYKRGLPPLPSRPAPTQLERDFALCSAQYDAYRSAPSLQLAAATTTTPADLPRRAGNV